MIGRLTGRLGYRATDHVLIEVGGVGYEVEAPMSTFYKLPATGEKLTLQTHLTVREDAHLLFGFATTAEKTLFRELIRVSAIGPKLALAILSGISVEEFWQVVRAGATVRFSKLPGIGKKTAERLVVEMRDKAGQGAVPGRGTAGQAVAMGPLQEARSALTALGYKPTEGDRLTDAVYEDGMRTEQIIQEALKRAAR